MDVAGLAGLLTALICALAALTTLINSRSQLRVLERLAAIREKLEPGSAARENVVQMERALSGRLLNRIQRTTLFALVWQWSRSSAPLSFGSARSSPRGRKTAESPEMVFGDGRSRSNMTGEMSLRQNYRWRAPHGANATNRQRDK